MAANEAVRIPGRPAQAVRHPRPDLSAPTSYMSSRPELDAFLPEALREWIADLAQQPLKPAMHSVPAVVLFADVSGFTALTEQLAAQGAQAIETLSEILNEFFRPAIEAIRHRGGDVLTLAGDSVVACWEGKPPRP